MNLWRVVASTVPRCTSSFAVLLSRPFFCLALAAARVHVAAQNPLGERLVTGEARGRSDLAFAGRFVVQLLGDACRLLLVDRALELEEAGQRGETHSVLSDIAVERVYSRPHVLEGGDQDFHLLVGESSHYSSPVRFRALRAAATAITNTRRTAPARPIGFMRAS